MPSLTVTGGVTLSGALRVPGAKNAALPILAAALLSKEPLWLFDCPKLRDVHNMLEILTTMGCQFRWEGDNTLWIDPSGAQSHEMPEHLSKQLRSSIFMLGPLLGRFGQAVATFPGGCEIGLRPIDLHLKALSALNVRIREEYGLIHCDGRDMKGGIIHLDYPSVGATENAMMAAVNALGETLIHNAAREPEIEDLQRFLRMLGFRVQGAGSHTISIDGGKRGATKTLEHRVLPDRIVAGTYLCAGAITGGDIMLTNVLPGHLGSVLDKLGECGCEITLGQGELRLIGPQRPKELTLVETQPYPGFPTDMQAQLFALCTVAQGASVIVENVFENRFKHAAEMMRMGATCTIKGRTAVIRGVPRLTGATVDAHDLRGGAALVLAGLRAQGQTIVRGAELIDRGYEAFETNLAQLGANIGRLP